MSLGTVTIIVPTYKRPEKVRRAILSVLNQTYRDIRVLVFDNASSDGTSDVVAGLMAGDSRIEYHCHSENIGIIGNFNFAMGRVESDYFGMLADDDYFLPNFIEDAMKAFQDHPRIDASILSAPTALESGEILFDQLDQWPREGLYEPGESILKSVDGNNPIITMCLFRRRIIHEFKFDQDTGCIADIPILISVLAKYPFHLSRKVGGYFIRHPGASGNKFAQVSNIRAFCKAWLCIEERFQANDTIEPRCRTRIVGGLKARVDRVLVGLMLASLMANNEESFLYAHGIINQRAWSIPRAASKFLWLIRQIASPAILVNGLNFVKWIRFSIRRFFGRRLIKIDRQN